MDFKVKFEDNDLIIKQLKQEEFNDLYNIAKDPNIWKQHPENDRWKKEKFAIFFKNGIDNEFGIYKIINKSNKEIIGSSRFYKLDPKDKAIRIGFTFITTKYWGTTTNFKIKKLMIDYALKFLDKIYFDIGENNIRSRKAMEKLGATFFSHDNKGMVVYKLNKIDFI